MCDFKMLPSQKQNRKVKGVLMVNGKEQAVGKLTKGTNLKLHNKFWKSNIQYSICSWKCCIIHLTLMRRFLHVFSINLKMMVVLLYVPIWNHHTTANLGMRGENAVL